MPEYEKSINQHGLKQQLCDLAEGMVYGALVAGPCTRRERKARRAAAWGCASGMYPALAAAIAVDDKGHRAKSRTRGQGDPESELWCSLVTLSLPPGDPRSRSDSAKKAIESELSKLRSRSCWDESKVREWGKVKVKLPNAHVATLFPIVGIKGHELPAEDGKWKGRIVLGGHNVRSADGQKVRSESCVFQGHGFYPIYHDGV